MIKKISKYKPSVLQSKLDFSATREMVLPGEWEHERLMLRLVVILLILLAFGYLYFVTASVLNIIASREANQRLVTLESSIGALEQKYFALSQNATPARGERLGLIPVSRTQYVYRPGNVGAATIQSNAI